MAGPGRRWYQRNDFRPRNGFRPHFPSKNRAPCQWVRGPARGDGEQVAVVPTHPWTLGAHRLRGCLPLLGKQQLRSNSGGQGGGPREKGETENPETWHTDTPRPRPCCARRSRVTLGGCARSSPLAVPIHPGSHCGTVAGPQAWRGPRLEASQAQKVHICSNGHSTPIWGRGWRHSPIGRGQDGHGAPQRPLLRAEGDSLATTDQTEMPDPPPTDSSRFHTLPPPPESHLDRSPQTHGPTRMHPHSPHQDPYMAVDTHVCPVAAHGRPRSWYAEPPNLLWCMPLTAQTLQVPVALFIPMWFPLHTWTHPCNQTQTHKHRHTLAPCR